MAEYVTDSAETLRNAECPCGHTVEEHGDGGCVNGWSQEPCDCLHDRAAALIASGAVRPAAEVRAEALRPVRDLILDLNADADYLVPKRHLGDRLRAALAEEGEDRG